VACRTAHCEARFFFFTFVAHAHFLFVCLLFFVLFPPFHPLLAAFAERNQDVVHYACSIRKDLYDVSDRGPFEQVAALSTGFDQVSALLFHPFENMLVVAEKRLLAVWDVKEFERVNLFSNENARGTKISAVSWINEQNQSLLMAGSDDGVVRLWKNVHVKDTQPEIVSAWLAVRSMPRGSGVGLVLDWQQETGHLLAAGPVDSIRVWDVEREICVLDLPVDSDRDSYVSSVCSMAEGGVVVAGCGDGAVRMFDLRATSHTIHTVSKHPGSVVQVRGQRWGGQGAEIEGDLLSGGINGDIHISDTRMLGGGGGGGGGYGHSVLFRLLVACGAGTACCPGHQNHRWSTTPATHFSSPTSRCPSARGSSTAAAR